MSPRRTIPSPKLGRDEAASPDLEAAPPEAQSVVAFAHDCPRAGFLGCADCALPIELGVSGEAEELRLSRVRRRRARAGRGSEAGRTAAEAARHHTAIEDVRGHRACRG